MAVLFNASNIHMYCTGTNFLRSTSSYSINAWIYNDWTAGTTKSLVGLYDGTPTVTGTPLVGMQIGTQGTGEVTCWMYGGAVIVKTATSSMLPYNNVWVMVTYTFDGTSNRIYVNNTLQATTTTALVDGLFTQIWLNGYPPTGNANETSNFQVDAYSYYNRTLSADEVSTIYNASGDRDGIEYGHLANYSFDELPEGSTVVSSVDLTGNGNTLQISGTGTAITYIYTGVPLNSNTRPCIVN